MKVIDDNEVNILVDSYHAGCKITGKPVYMDDILDLINTVKTARYINMLSRIIVDSKTPLTFEDKKLCIITDDNNSIDTDAI